VAINWLLGTLSDNIWLIWLSDLRFRILGDWNMTFWEWNASGIQSRPDVLEITMITMRTYIASNSDFFWIGWKKRILTITFSRYIWEKNMGREGNGDLPLFHRCFLTFPWCFVRWESYNKDPSLLPNGGNTLWSHVHAVISSRTSWGYVSICVKSYDR